MRTPLGRYTAPWNVWGGTAAIVSFLGDVLKKRYGVGTDTVFMDRASMYFEASQKGIVRVGYSRDHRPDRPQATVGSSMDEGPGMPMGLTADPGNILDVTHFDDAFRQIMPLLPKDAMIVFDNGAYSKDNAKMLDSNGFGLVTRLQLNTAGCRSVKAHVGDSISIDDDVSYLKTEGNLGRTGHIFRNSRPRSDVLYRCYRKAERDWDEMRTIRKDIDSGMRPRKKYRNSNCFVDTRLSYMFPLMGRTGEEAVDMAVKGMMTGRASASGICSGRPEYSRHYFNSIGEYSKDCLDLAKSVWQKQVVSSSIIKSDEINEIFIKRMAEELDKITGSSPLEKYDLVYFYYRNGYHFNPEPEYTHGTFVWMPLQSKQLFELYHATHDTFRNARLELDLIKAMNPLLMEIPFSSEKDDGDYTDNEYDLIGDRSLYLKNILHESKSTMEKWIEATDKRGYEIKNKVADHENNETIILSLMNKVKILFRINNGYYFKKAGYGLVYYVLSNLNSPGRIRVLYYNVSSIIDQVRLMKGDDGIDQYMLSINLLTNTPAKRELESLIETFSPEMDENKTL